MGRFHTLQWVGIGSFCSVFAMAGCASGETEKSNQRSGPSAGLNQPAAAALPKDYRLQLEPDPGIRFPMPRKGVELSVSSFDTTLPAYKFRHEVNLVMNDVVRVVIHVWDNPLHLGSREWFNENMAELAGANATVSHQLVSKQRLPAVMLDTPAGEALSLARAVFATENHVYEVVCIDPTNHPEAKVLFDRVVDGFEPEVSR